MSDFDWNDAPFEGTSVLPEQFFMDRRKYDDPIQRLMFAVLDDVIRCYQNNLAVQRPRARYLLAEAKEWLFRVPSTGPFSFESIYDVLDIDARWLRRALVRWRDQKVAVHQPRTVARRSPAVHKERPSKHGFLGRREAVAAPLRTAQRSSAVD
jgi:hypothetical protein